MLNHTDVIIIGGGVIGCGTAYYLAKRGISVTVLESHTIGYGASSSNAGGVRQSARDERELPIAMFTMQHIWPRLSEELELDVEFCQTGNLRLGKTEKHMKMIRILAESCSKSGLLMDVLTAGEVQKICPDLAPDIAGAGWCPTDGHANPLLTTLGFYRQARRMGARFITGEKVIKIEKYKGAARKVMTRSGNVYEADTILLAAGYGSREIANTVGIDLPLARVFDECMVTEAQPPMLKAMLGTADADFYGHQTVHGSFVFGGNSGFERYHKVTEESKDSTAITPPCIARSVIKYMPTLAGAKIIRHWAGWLDKCSDGVPIIGKVSEVPGLVIAAGFSGHGFGISPGVGYLLGELIAGERLSCDMKELRYDRFRADA